MLKYLKEQGLVSSLDEENLKVLLTNCNLISMSDSFDETNISEQSESINSKDDNSSTVINLNEFENTRNKKTVNKAMETLSNRLNR